MKCVKEYTRNSHLCAICGKIKNRENTYFSYKLKGNGFSGYCKECDSVYKIILKIAQTPKLNQDIELRKRVEKLRRLVFIVSSISLFTSGDSILTAMKKAQRR